MNQHHILTVGISLLTNFARARGCSADDALRQHRALADYLRADPAQTSAEISSLDSRTGFLDGNARDLAVTLLFTTTDQGKAVASLLEKELKFRKIVVAKLPLRGFDAPARDVAPDFAAREAAAALADMRQHVVEHVIRLQKATPPPRIELNITGGYKAECAVLYELGRALRLPVYYLHETFQVAVELP